MSGIVTFPLIVLIKRLIFLRVDDRHEQVDLNLNMKDRMGRIQEDYIKEWIVGHQL